MRILSFALVAWACIPLKCTPAQGLNTDQVAMLAEQGIFGARLLTDHPGGAEKLGNLCRVLEFYQGGGSYGSPSSAPIAPLKLLADNKSLTTIVTIDANPNGTGPAHEGIFLGASVVPGQSFTLGLNKTHACNLQLEPGPAPAPPADPMHRSWFFNALSVLHHEACHLGLDGSCEQLARDFQTGMGALPASPESLERIAIAWDHCEEAIVRAIETRDTLAWASGADVQLCNELKVLAERNIAAIIAKVKNLDEDLAMANQMLQSNPGFELQSLVAELGKMLEQAQSALDDAERSNQQIMAVCPC